MGFLGYIMYNSINKSFKRKVITVLIIFVVCFLCSLVLLTDVTKATNELEVNSGGLVEIHDLVEFSNDYGKFNEFGDSLDEIVSYFKEDREGIVYLEIPESYGSNFESLVFDIFSSVFKNYSDITALDCVSWRSGKFSGRLDNGIWKIKYNISKEALDDYKRIKSYSHLLNSLVNENMTKKEAVEAFNNYIVENKEYDYSLNDYSRTSESVFDSNMSICSGFSKFMQLACYSVGVESEYLSGYVGEGTESHAWNKVLLGDEWYYIDTTWNLDSDLNEYGLSKVLWSDHELKNV